VPVLRGWIAPGDEAAARVPSSEVRVSGVLQPDEIFYADAPVEGGVVAAISQSSLQQAWGESVPPGYVVLATQDPVTAPAPLPVPATIQTADVPFPLQNFFYAFQWWIFAAFGVFLYVRWLRIEARRSQVAVSDVD
jgi:cytochrome oxidase assembly protein ShyY1